MLFNSYEFLFLFLPIVLIGYYGLFRKHGRLVFLTLASYFFYGWWDYRFCSLMVISTLIDYMSGRGIARSDQPKVRKRWLLVSMISNLSLLGFFKYWDLLAITLNNLFSFLPIPDAELLPVLRIILPVGISFYTFQSMSYSIDIYMGEAKPARDLWSFACYVALFPQLIAGPIVRYREIAEQLVHRDHTMSKFAAGCAFFIVGLAKKVIIADAAATLVPLAFGVAEPGSSAAWLGVLGYTMQIYFDFSGYSDMAVGLGFMLGFTFPQNFNSPYKAISITDFWRRWHISLSTWLRDYLYIPLGGSRNGPWRTYGNLFITMLLGGLWHGASWTFVLWGGYHGGLLALERALGKRSFVSKMPRAIQVAVTFVLVMVGWILFRCESLSQAGGILGAMFTFGLLSSSVAIDWGGVSLGLIVTGLALIAVFRARNTWEISWKPGVSLALFLAALLVVCVVVILVNTSSPFLYFQF